MDHITDFFERGLYIKEEPKNILQKPQGFKKEADLAAVGAAQADLAAGGAAQATLQKEAWTTANRPEAGFAGQE